MKKRSSLGISLVFPNFCPKIKMFSKKKVFTYIWLLFFAINIVAVPKIGILPNFGNLGKVASPSRLSGTAMHRVLFELLHITKKLNKCTKLENLNWKINLKVRNHTQFSSAVIRTPFAIRITIVFNRTSAFRPTGWKALR